MQVCPELEHTDSIHTHVQEWMQQARAQTQASRGQDCHACLHATQNTVTRIEHQKHKTTHKCTSYFHVCDKHGHKHTRLLMEVKALGDVANAFWFEASDVLAAKLLVPVA